MRRTWFGACLRAALLAALPLVALAPVSSWAASALPVERVVSPGGIVAWLVEDHSNPVISLGAGFAGGAAVDPEGKSGLAQMVSGLLSEGAGELTAEAFASRLVEIGAEVGAEASDDSFVVTMRMLSASREPGFDLLKAMLTAPRFDPEPLERVRNDLATLLVQKTNDPYGLADMTWEVEAFPDHPYGRETLGTPQTVASISVADLRQFIRARFARDNLFVGVVGDVTPAELGPLLDRTFGALPASAAPAQVADVKVGADGKVVVVDMAIPQSIIVFGQDGPSLHDPDYDAMLVVDHILGSGGLTSRLMQELRDRRGLIYSLSTFLFNQRHAQTIVGYVGTPNAAVGQVLDVIRAEWRRMAEEGPSEQEVADAKLYLVGSYPLRFTDTRTTASALVGAQLNGLGMDIFARRTEDLEAVTLEDARRAARRFLDPDRLLIVVAGQPDAVTASASPAADRLPPPADPASTLRSGLTLGGHHSAP
jgi:zinc protease